MEERHRVYDGTAEPRPDRSFCSLCGLVVYEAVRERTIRPPSGSRQIASGEA
ncbi:MAG: hypothetical protein ABI782_02530 [Anaerolineaceae bacterium]